MTERQHWIEADDHARGLVGGRPRYDAEAEAAHAEDLIEREKERRIEREISHEKERQGSLEMELQNFGEKAKKVAMLRKKMWRDMDALENFLVDHQTAYSAYIKESRDCLMLDLANGEANETWIEQLAQDLMEEMEAGGKQSLEDGDVYEILESLFIVSRNLSATKEEMEELIWEIRANDRLDEKRLGPLMFAARKIAKGERDEYAFAWAANEILEELSK